MVIIIIFTSDFTKIPVICYLGKLTSQKGFPCSSVSKESACSAGDQVQSLDQEDPLETGMATYSSILAWKVLGTEGPGGLQSMRSQESDTT